MRILLRIERELHVIFNDEKSELCRKSWKIKNCKTDSDHDVIQVSLLLILLILLISGVSIVDF